LHRRDNRGNTLLHSVLVTRSLKPALIQRVWERDPGALFIANERGETPFDYAIALVNEWAIEHFQWKLSLWSIEEALGKKSIPFFEEQIKAQRDANRDFEKWCRESVNDLCCCCHEIVCVSSPVTCSSQTILLMDLKRRGLIFNVRKSSDHPLACENSLSPI